MYVQHRSDERINGRSLRWTPVRLLLTLGAAVAVVAGAASGAQAARSCGNMTVPGASGPVVVRIDVVRGSVSCRRARAVTAYAWSPKHRSHEGNKFLGDPAGWSCAAGRATQPAVAGLCVRRSDRARVTAFYRR